MSISVRGSGARDDCTYCAGISGETAPFTATKLLSPAGCDYAAHAAGLVSSISVNGDYLAESSAEGSIPSLQRRHHVDLRWTTGAAHREILSRWKRPPALF